MQDEPAFPIPRIDLPGAYEAHPGMSLRDWLAGQIAAAVMGGWMASNTSGELPHATAATIAYDLADAMLVERAKRGA